MELHCLLFAINNTQNALASIFGCVNSFAGWITHRTTPYPSEIAAGIDRIVIRNQQLAWPAPLCGIMSV